MPRSIRPYLEYQADRVEAVLAAHRTPGRVVGGTVGPRLIRFFLNPAPHIRFANVKRLEDDIAMAMQTHLEIKTGKEGVILEFANPNPHPVNLVALWDEFGTRPIGTAILGLTDDGAPLAANLRSPMTAHVLITGATGSGKTVLARTIAVSLLMSTKPGLLGIAIIDPKAKIFPKDFQCSRLIRPVVTKYGEAAELMNSLVKLMESRDARGVTAPTEADPIIVAFIDELADLIMADTGQQLENAITRLTQRGRQAMIHVVALTQKASAAILSQLMRANFTLRLVGKVVTAEDARVGAGVGGTNAHLLNGLGDFIAVNGGDKIRFQVAYISAKDLRSIAGLFEHRVVSLPHAQVEPQKTEPSLDDMTIFVAKLKPWWLEHADTHGSKTQAVKILFGQDAEPAGYNWRTTMRAIALIEAEAANGIQ